MSKKIFMGGICGMGMCPLAIFLRRDGNEVCGFDDSPNQKISAILEAEGVTISGRRLPENAPDEFIITSALAKNAGELKKSGAKKFLRRGEALAEICESRKLIALCGSHGKTTTTSLIAHAINSMNLNSGYMVGAIPSGFSPVRHCKKGEFFAAEIDESDATIENFSPFITIALNGDLDHTDTYPDTDSLKAMFARLFARTQGAVIIPAGDRFLKEAAHGISAKLIEVDLPKHDFLEYDKQMAAAALHEAFNKKIGMEIFDDFTGIGRRQEILADTNDIFAIADYAHHPFEVSSFMEWLDKKISGPKLIFFQPHRYTRTKRFAEDFKRIFKKRADMGDKVFILPVYAASECADAEGCSHKISGDTIQLAEFSDMEPSIKAYAQKHAGKIYAAFIGAGDIYFKAKESLEKF